MKYIANPPDLLHPRLSACKNTAYSTSRFSTINYSIALPPNLGSSLIRLKLSFSFKILVSSIPTKRRISSVVKVPIGILNVFLDRTPQRSDCAVPVLFGMASIRRCFRVKSMTKAQNGQTLFFESEKLCFDPNTRKKSVFLLRRQLVSTNPDAKEPSKDPLRFVGISIDTRLGLSLPTQSAVSKSATTKAPLRQHSPKRHFVPLSW